MSDLPACDVQRVAVIANRTSRASATSLTHALVAGWRMRAAAAAKRASSGREYRAVSRMLTNSPATPSQRLLSDSAAAPVQLLPEKGSNTKFRGLVKNRIKNSGKVGGIRAG